MLARLTARPLLALALPLGLGLWAAAPAPGVDPLARAGIAVSAGAAPGYVADSVCEDCHGALYDSYQQVGMARSFSRPRPESAIEDFGRGPFEHPASRQRFELSWRDGRLVFRRDQLGPDGAPINVFERPVDFVLGSGQHARTYLYRTPGGELYQLPIDWYPQERRFAMAPGYDRPDHQGVLRRVRRECLFCHDAYPDVPKGSDAGPAPHVFPRELPEGTGCQRCHGPAAEHVRAMLSVPPDRERARAAIVNPARLPPERRDDVCFECHLQPAVALAGLRRFGRADYSFRPGQALPDYLVQMDVVEQGQAPAERFEINHHPYRLRQSRCYRESAGRLHCLSCHDPHRKPPPERRAARYRAACLRCHAETACRRPGHGADGPGEADCASCHMPKRRTQDVVHVVMTDHLIRRQPGGEELLAPLEEQEPVLVDARLLDAERGPQGELGELYRALAVLRASGSRPAAARFEQLLLRLKPPEPEPWLDLAQAQLRDKRLAAAEGTLRELLARQPDLQAAQALLPLVLAAQGRRAEALRLLAAPPGPEGDQPETLYNLGRLLLADKRPAEACAALERALALRDNFVPAWYQLGQARRAARQGTEAVAAFSRALEIDPTHTASYLALGELLSELGKRSEALRYLRHGRRVAAQPDQLAAALGRLEGR